MKILDINDSSFAHLTLILSLRYLVKCRRRSLAVYKNEFVLLGKIEILSTRVIIFSIGKSQL